MVKKSLVGLVIYLNFKYKNQNLGINSKFYIISEKNKKNGINLPLLAVS